MKTETDRNFLTRLGHVAAASESPAAITADPKWHQTVQWVQQESIVAYQRLDKASDGLAQDQTENKAAQAAWNTAIGAAAKFVGWLADDLRHRLRSTRPGDPEPTAAEKQKIEGFLNTFQPFAPSELIKLRAAAAVPHLNTLATILEQYPQWVAKPDVAAVQQHAMNCEEKWKALVAEGLDDDGIRDELVQARAQAQATMVGARMILNGILTLSQSPLTLDELILNLSKQQPNAQSTTDETALDPGTPAVNPPTAETL